MSDFSNKCYSCKYRRNVPGDCHSSCEHPKAGDGIAGFIKLLMGENPLNIRANSHGVSSGWFTHPLNFDPVWLENCDGFEEIENNK